MEEQLDTMGVWSSPWAEACLVEGNKFWFYSLVCSILLGVVQLYDGRGEVKSESGEKGKSKKQGVQAHKEKLSGIKRRMMVDCFDLFIPGFVTGWLVTTQAFVGFAGAVSTVLSSKDIWDRLQK
jgi:Peroxisomal biogenesis factor 11 (PEX11)